MSYSWDKFLRPLGTNDTNIQIMDNTGVVTYTVNPFTVINLYVKNNMVVISLKSQRLINIPFSSNNEAKLGLPRIKQLIDTLQQNSPIFINNEIKNYITAVSAKFFYQSTTPTGTGTSQIKTGSFWYDAEYGNLYTYIYDGDYYQWVTAVGEIGPIGGTGPAGTSGTSGYDGDSFRVEYNSAIDLSTTTVSSTYSITVDPSLSYSAAQLILISYDASNYIEGQVESYNSSTGELVYEVLAKYGSSSYSNWVVNLDGAAGGDGTSGTSGTSGINGTSGTSAVNGTSGTRGTSGTSGSSGTRGTSGTSGVNGTSGTSGSTGTSGTSGLSPASGTVMLLSANETPVSGSTNTTAFSYTLAANAYSKIIIESECGLFTNANTNATVTFNIVVGGVNKRSKIVRLDATGTSDQHDVGRNLKYSEAIAAGATITITTTSSSGGTWTVDSLRVYGVI